MKALFITQTELKRKSMIGGNVDSDKFIQFIEVAQDTHIQNYLGTKLYDKLQSLITSNTINDAENSDYKTLLETYVAPMLVWYAQADYYAFAPFQVSNGGVFKHRSENSDTPSIEEVHMLVTRCKDTAEFYTRRFMDHMDFNSTLYPEYNQTSNGGMYPDKSDNFSSWVL
jgi:hypothetical protein